MPSYRWSPPLTILGGRVGPRSFVPSDGDVLSKLKAFYLDQDSCPNIFVRKIPRRMRKLIGLKGQSVYLRDLTPELQYKCLINTFYRRMSKHFCKKMFTLLKEGKLHRVEQWFNTTDGILMPLLINNIYDEPMFDRLIKFSMENCANNYSQFQRALKDFRKDARKAFILGEKPKPSRQMSTFASAFKLLKYKSSPQERFCQILTMCQTRGTGLADSVMASQSLQKFVTTVTAPSRLINLDARPLWDATCGAQYARGQYAKLSIGPTAVLESPRHLGGGTKFLEKLAQEYIDYSYDFITMERIPVPVHRISTTADVVSRCIEEYTIRPKAVLEVRTHVVLEPAKARVITVASGYYQILQSLMAHMFAPCVTNRYTRSGMKANRHMWNFLRDSLDPANYMWGALHEGVGGKIFALSTDLQEATDYGNLTISSQIYGSLVDLASTHPDFPRGLAELCCKMYNGPRTIKTKLDGKDVEFQRTRGWFMGDYMTKVILTAAQLYALHKTGIKAASIVGDDFIGLSTDRSLLVKHIDNLKSMDFKVSESDTYISDKYMFYTEEGALVPQKAEQLLYNRMKLGKRVPYVDYPRTRLLLPVLVSTDTFSQTNVGKHSLLGKESLYVHRIKSTPERVFEIATLIQHLTLRSDKDVLCPFTPIEIGGDGSYTPDNLFFREVVRKKSRTMEKEVLYRLEKSLKTGFMPRLYRSERLTQTITKHQMLVMISEEIKASLPEKSIIIPRDNEERHVLESFRGPCLKDPLWAWARLLQQEYYQSILDGEIKPPRAFPELSRVHYGSSYRMPPEEEVIKITTTFNTEVGRRSLRTFESVPYYVRTDLVQIPNYLSMNWDFRPKSIKDSNRYLTEVLDYRETHGNIILNLDLDNLPQSVVDSAHLIMDPDVIVRHKSIKALREGNVVFVITHDLDLVRSIYYSQSVIDRIPVYAVDPIFYISGLIDKVESITGITDYVIVEDAGSIAWTQAKQSEITPEPPDDAPDHVWEEFQNKYWELLDSLVAIVTPLRGTPNLYRVRPSNQSYCDTIDGISSLPGLHLSNY